MLVPAREVQGAFAIGYGVFGTVLDGRLLEKDFDRLLLERNNGG